MSNDEIDHQKDKSSEKSQLFSDNRENKISLYLRKVSPLLDRFAESSSKKSSASDSDQVLFCLIVDTIVCDGIFVVATEVVDPLGDISDRIFVLSLRIFHRDMSESVYAECTDHTKNTRIRYRSPTPSADIVHEDDHWSDDED
jgi:hypothetical protein